MINRIALKSAVRPASRLAFRQAPIGVRFMSTPTPAQQDPKQKASSIIEALPGTSLLSKTGILATSAAAAIYAISNGLLIIHDETILVLTFASFTTLVAKFVAPLYTEWADGEIKKVRDILSQSREKHVKAVESRIENVGQLSNVVEETKDLFNLSKETAKFESDSFVLKQKLAVHNEAKSVLDSWVRFENQQRQIEQEQLANFVIEKVQKDIENQKFQERVLQEALNDVEKLFAKK
ncbi:unnamed protein product [Candida verbasci]|uniref:ATP synthase subunit 4 n=1 Tax=Candida verbasci TaxID=1227364 RepID=A0A9W4TUX3_9ASCO|nr:unnamed protein product [Candida verbasci]